MSARANGTPSKTYSFDPGPDGTDYVMNVEARLARAKADGVITEYDDGRNLCPWFRGPPGPRLRALREEFRRAPRRGQEG
jgi:hypothetical protein